MAVRKKEVERELYELGSEIDELSSLLDEVYKNDGVECARYIKLLRTGQMRLRRKVDKLKVVAGTEWRDLQENVQWLMNDLQTKIDDLLPMFEHHAAV